MGTGEEREFAIDALLGPLNEFEKRNAPQRIWASGDTELLRDRARVAVVGSRRASTDGLKRAVRFARELAQANVVVVSGLAEGIDTAAHGATIEAGGKTIAVLGTALNQCFPKSNEFLQRKIASEHLLLSQFAPGSPIRATNFPTRNCLMALIADATVIVEAREGSGTIHAGWEALRLGRPLFLMRSLVASSPLEWVSVFLEHGARELSATEQVLDSVPKNRAATLGDARA